jgi:dephospho-CoA kinase
VQFEKDAKLETELQIRDLKERAEFVIRNDGTLEELYAQVDDIVATLRKRVG